MRGPEPSDRALFDESGLGAVREAAGDLRFLLGRGYAQKSAIMLVGDRHRLTKRQRQLLFRAVFAPADAAEIAARRLDAAALTSRALLVDGYNVLITLETALAGGMVIRCDDGYLRDLAEAHGSYRENDNTERAIELVSGALCTLGAASIQIWLDRPMSFSARLRERLAIRLGSVATSVELADSADAAIKARFEPAAVAVTGDSAILRLAPGGFDLVAWIAEREAPSAWIVEPR